MAMRLVPIGNRRDFSAGRSREKIPPSAASSQVGRGWTFDRHISRGRKSRFHTMTEATGTKSKLLK
jgi:hypothetical protein